MATKRKFYSQIGYSNKDCVIGRHLSSDKPYLVLEIPQEILVYWHGLKVKSTSNSYANFIGETQALPFGLVGPSLEKRINDAALIAARECRGKSGNQKKKLLQKIRRVNVCRGDIAEPLAEAEPQAEAEPNQRNEELSELEERCSELYLQLLKEKEKAKQSENGFKNCEAEINLLQEENTTLGEYINNIEKLNVCQNCTDYLGNKSNTLGNVCPRQRQRKLKELKTKAERALWFLDSYGATSKTLLVEDSNGEEIKLDISLGDKSAKKSKFEDLADEEKVRIKEVLQVLDTFCIGDAAYHELSEIKSGLPRSYLIKQCRSEINGCFTITRTQGDLVGAQMNFREELRRKLKEKVENGQKGCQKVKISGDGAKISRISNYIVMSFALLSDEQDVMSTKGNHAFAVLCGKECYDSMAVSFQELFEEINTIIKEGEMDIDGENIKLEFFLGGDYKFLLTMLGMNAANSIYACIYCKIHKDERWDMTKPENYYWADEMKRTLEDIKTRCTQKKDNFGCISPPLLDIAIENVRVDELHLLLRVTDVLEKNLIINAVRWDSRDDKNKKSSDPKGLHLEGLVKAINECGISFMVWKKLDGTGKKTSGYDWRSLVGEEKKKLLQRLPEKFHKVLRPETCNTVKQVWQGFEELYKTITDWAPSKEKQDVFFKQACDWVNLFLTLKDKEEGYSKANITPYIHLLVYHVPKYVSDEDGFKIFTGQGVEKTNDVVRNIYHKKCNKHDACKDSLLALKRLDYLQDHKRKPSSYIKHDDEYWRTTIFDNRRKRPRLCRQLIE